MELILKSISNLKFLSSMCTGLICKENNIIDKEELKTKEKCGMSRHYSQKSMSIASSNEKLLIDLFYLQHFSLESQNTSSFKAPSQIDSQLNIFQQPLMNLFRKQIFGFDSLTLFILDILSFFCFAMIWDASSNSYIMIALLTIVISYFLIIYKRHAINVLEITDYTQELEFTALKNKIISSFALLMSFNTIFCFASQESSEGYQTLQLGSVFGCFSLMLYQLALVLLTIKMKAYRANSIIYDCSYLLKLKVGFDCMALANSLLKRGLQNVLAIVISKIGIELLDLIIQYILFNILDNHFRLSSRIENLETSNKLAKESNKCFTGKIRSLLNTNDSEGYIALINMDEIYQNHYMKNLMLKVYNNSKSENLLCEKGTSAASNSPTKAHYLNRLVSKNPSSKLIINKLIVTKDKSLMRAETKSTQRSSYYQDTINLKILNKSELNYLIMLKELSNNENESLFDIIYNCQLKLVNNDKYDFEEEDLKKSRLKMFDLRAKDNSETIKRIKLGFFKNPSGSINVNINLQLTLIDRSRVCESSLAENQISVFQNSDYLVFTEIFLQDMQELAVVKHQLSNQAKDFGFNISKAAHEFKTPINTIISLCETLIPKISNNNNTNNINRINYATDNFVGGYITTNLNPSSVSGSSNNEITEDIKLVRGLCHYTTFLIQDFIHSLHNQELSIELKLVNIFELLQFVHTVTNALLKNSGKENVRCELNYFKTLDHGENCEQAKTFVKNFEKNYWVKTDDIRLKQVLLNLISNSVKFTNYGSIIIELDFVHLPNSNSPKVGQELDLTFSGKISNDLIIYIKDSGSGLSHDQMDKIKQKKSNELLVDRNVNSMGTSLGLSVCQTILDKLDYQMDISSSKEGTIISLLMHDVLAKNEEQPKTNTESLVKCELNSKFNTLDKMSKIFKTGSFRDMRDMKSEDGKSNLSEDLKEENFNRRNSLLSMMKSFDKKRFLGEKQKLLISKEDERKYTSFCLDEIAIDREDEIINREHSFNQIRSTLKHSLPIDIDARSNVSSSQESLINLPLSNKSKSECEFPGSEIEIKLSTHNFNITVSKPTKIEHTKSYLSPERKQSESCIKQIYSKKGRLSEVINNKITLRTEENASNKIINSSSNTFQLDVHRKLKLSQNFYTKYNCKSCSQIHSVDQSPITKQGYDHSENELNSGFASSLMMNHPNLSPQKLGKSKIQSSSINSLRGDIPNYTYEDYQYEQFEEFPLQKDLKIKQNKLGKLNIEKLNSKLGATSSQHADSIIEENASLESAPVNKLFNNPHLKKVLTEINNHDNSISESEFSLYSSKTGLKNKRDSKSKTFQQSVNMPVFIVADDSPSLRKSLKNVVEKCLRKNSIRAITVECCDGLDIVNLVVKDQKKGNNIVCILTDENMEFYNGSEALKILKRFEDDRRIKLMPKMICVTSFEDEYSKDSLYALGFDGILQKSPRVEQIELVLRELNLMQ